MQNNKKFITFFLNFWLPVFVWALIIYSFSSIPIKPVSEIYWKDFIIKKIAHIVEYGIFSLLLYRALRGSKLKPKRACMYSIFFAVIYGFFDEYHQSFTPGRESKIRDVIFDTIGANLSIFLIWRLSPKVPQKLKNLVRDLQIL